MQMTLEIPDHLAQKLEALPDAPQFLLNLLTTSLESGLNEDQWWALLDDIEQIAVDTGLTDLAERHDHFGVAKGKFEVPDTIDAHNAEVARLFLRNSSIGDQM